MAALLSLLNFAGVLQPGDLRITVNSRDRSNRSHLPHPIIIFIIVIIVVVIVVVVIVCVINENSFDPCDGSTWSRKSKSVTKCNFCFKPVQLYGSRW